MQILKSGSLINLESRETIEQLIFTAKVTASAAIKTASFTLDAEKNRRLASEIWEGARYLCRDHERAQIRDIFVDNFLEHLREIRGGPAVLNNLPEDSGRTTTPAPRENESAQSESVGVIAEPGPPTGQGSEASEISSTEIIVDSTNPGTPLPGEMVEREIPKGDASENAATDGDKVSDITDSTGEHSTQPIPKTPIEAERCQKTAVAPIALPENESYQFDNCIVTATVQLIPTGDGTRKAVLSVRTHDFAPQISTLNLTGEPISEILIRELEKAFEKYRNDLPVKVMDKLKKQKAAGKGQVSSANSKPDHPSPGSVSVAEPKKNLQGSLFGS